MTRFLALLLLAFLVWTVLETLIGAARGRLGGGRPRPRVRPPAPPAPPPPAAPVELLVRCAACGVFVPESRALAGPAGPCCSERCRAAARARAG